MLFRKCWIGTSSIFAKNKSVWQGGGVGIGLAGADQNLTEIPLLLRLRRVGSVKYLVMRRGSIIIQKLP